MNCYPPFPNYLEYSRAIVTLSHTILFTPHLFPAYPSFVPRFSSLVFSAFNVFYPSYPAYPSFPSLQLLHRGCEFGEFPETLRECSNTWGCRIRLRRAPVNNNIRVDCVTAGINYPVHGANVLLLLELEHWCQGISSAVTQASSLVRMRPTFCQHQIILTRYHSSFLIWFSPYSNVMVVCATFSTSNSRMLKVFKVNTYNCDLALTGLITTTCRTLDKLTNRSGQWKPAVRIALRTPNVPPIIYNIPIPALIYLTYVQMTILNALDQS